MIVVDLWIIILLIMIPNFSLSLYLVDCNYFWAQEQLHYGSILFIYYSFFNFLRLHNPLFSNIFIILKKIYFLFITNIIIKAVLC